MAGQSKPPAAGKGRPKGALNKITTAMKDAVMSVYQDLQDEAGGDHAHFRQWANDNPTDFYKIASKLLPLDVRGTHDVNVSGGVLEHKEAARAEVAELFGPTEPAPIDN